MSNNQINIRKANISDSEALTKCIHEAYDIYSSRLGDVVLPPMKVDYKEEIRDFPTWIAELVSCLKNYDSKIGNMK